MAYKTQGITYKTQSLTAVRLKFGSPPPNGGFKALFWTASTMYGLKQNKPFFSEARLWRHVLEKFLYNHISDYVFISIGFTLSALKLSDKSADSFGNYETLKLPKLAKYCHFSVTFIFS